MASQVSPGIVIRERDLTNSVVRGVQQITGALASTFQKGPIEEVVGINSQKELVEVFGTPNDSNAEDWFVASEFLQYGGRLALVRADSAGALNATASGSGVKVKNSLDWEGGTGNAELYVARTAGTWGDSLKVVTVDRGADQVVTLAATPAAAINAGDTVTFTVEGETKTALVYDWDGTSELTVILDDPTVLLDTDSVLDDPDQVGEATGSLTVQSGGSGYTASDVVAQTGTTGTGSALTAEILTIADGVLTGTGVVATGGDTYEADDVVAVTGGGGAGGTIRVTGVTGGGGIDTFEIVDGGSGYTAGALTVAVGSQTGTGAAATVNLTTSDGVALTAQVSAGGTGHVVGDVITVVGGAELEVTAVVNDTTAITSVVDWYTSTTIPGTDLTLATVGPRPGTSIFAEGKGLKYDEFHVAVIDADGKLSGNPGTVLERLTYLSKLSDGKTAEGASAYYKTVINEQSEYIYAGATLAADQDPSTAGAGVAWAQESTDLTSGDIFNLVASDQISTDLSGGADDYAYGASAYDAFLSTEEETVDFVLMGGSFSTTTETKAKAAKVISIAASRQDSLAFVSPHRGAQIGAGGVLPASQQKTKTINFFAGLTSTSYAVFDSGYKYLYDRFNDKFRYVPCNGDVAGLCVNTSAILDDWYSPAGLSRGSLRNAIKLAYNPSKADRDELFQGRINPITSIKGSGIVLFGDKTALSAPSAFDRINVRRLFINIRKRAEGLAQGVLFEQNDALTRSGFAGALNAYLSEVQIRRGVTDFLVVCDETNNTPDVIDRNEFVAEIFVKPSRSINYVTVTVTATRTGVSFAEVLGTAA